MSATLAKDGFQIVSGLLSESEVGQLRAGLGALCLAPGHRQLMRRVPEVAALARSAKILDLLTGITGSKPLPVRSIFFDKTPEANWLISWHQDLTIAVKERRDLPGYGPWSEKEGSSACPAPGRDSRSDGGVAPASR